MSETNGRLETDRVTTVLRRFPKLELETEEPQWRETFTLRGLRQLPLRLGV